LRGGAPTGRARGADDHILALAHVAAQHFRRRSVGEPERERDGRGLAVGADDPDAAGGATAHLTGGGGHLLVARLLLSREECADARPLGLADLLGLGPALSIRQALQRAQLLTPFLEDRLELPLLVLAQAEPLDQTLANLLDRGRTARRRTAGRTARGIRRR